MRDLFRITAWTLLLTIVVLSIVPPDERPVTSAPHSVEHLAIFLLTGLAFGLGYRTQRLAQAAALVIFAGAIELAQLGISGRHARLSDFVVDALSTTLGVALAMIVPKAVSEFRILRHWKA